MMHNNPPMKKHETNYSMKSITEKPCSRELHPLSSAASLNNRNSSASYSVRKRPFHFQHPSGKALFVDFSQS